MSDARIESSEPRRLACGHIAPEELPGRMPRPASMCPACLRQRLAKQPDGRHQPVRNIGLVNGVPSHQEQRMLAYFDAHPSRAPWPNRAEEVQAIDQIDAEREANRAKETEHRKFGLRGARLVTERYERGRWRQWYKLPGSNDLVEKS